MAFKLRKRVILTVFLTIGFLISTNSLWLVRKPIRTELDITGAQNAKVEVQLNRKDNNDFIKINQARVKINNDSEHLIIKNRTSKKAKRFRLNITDLEIGKTFEIKNINLHFNKCKLNELDKFIIKGANFEIKGNALIITPKSNNVTILYDKSINEKAQKKFEFELFVIILILSSLLGYKLLDYVADFSSIEHKSRVDIVFLCIFFTMLFIPMSHINQDNKSTTENRMLAKWKPLVNKDGSLNYNFGKDYETWYNDRFNGRLELLKISQQKNLYTANNSKGFVDKKNRFLYGNYEFKEIKQIEKIFKELKKFEIFLLNNDIKFYILIVPNKVFIYPTHVQKFNSNYAKEIDIQKEKNNLKIIYPVNIFIKESKSKPIFFQTDHHWTDYGAYLAYKELIHLIKKDFPRVKTLNENDYKIFYNNRVRAEDDRLFIQGCYCNTLNIPDNVCSKFLTTNYKYYQHKNFSKLEIKTYNESKNWSKSFYYPAGEDLKVLIIGTSMIENLLEFIPYNFKYTKKIRTNGVKDINHKDQFKIMKYYSQQILDYKPDILVLCVTIPNLPNLINLFEE